MFSLEICVCELYKMNYLKLKKNDKSFLSLTSLHVAEFEHLLSYFEPPYERYYKWHTIDGKTRKLPRIKANAKEQIPSSGHKLFFLLTYLKNNRIGSPTPSELSSEIIWYQSRSSK